MEKLFTERAHLTCPHMNFGIVMSVAHEFDGERIKTRVGRLADHHPFLKSVLGHDENDNSFYYDVGETSRIDLMLREETITGEDDPEVLKEYERHTSYDWDVTKEGLLKIVAWSSPDKTARDKTVFLLTFHHLLADGRGALHLAMELADSYKANSGADALGTDASGTAFFNEPASHHEFVREKLISSANELPQNSGLPFLSRMLVDKANKDWIKEGNAPLKYEEYHAYADGFVKKDRVRIVISKTEPEELKKTVAACKEHSVTVNDFLMAKTFIEEKTGKIIIAKDIRDALPFYHEGALGNYSTAFSVEIKKRVDDVWALASEVHKKVQKILSDPKRLYLVLQCYARLKPEVLDAAFMAAKGAYQSKSAEFIGKTFFAMDSPRGYSITNLGKIESDSITGAYFIPPASPAIRKTVGVLTVNGRMIECTCERMAHGDGV